MKPRRPPPAFVPLLLAALLGVQSRRAAASPALVLSLDPPRLELKARPGGEATAAAELRNEGTSAVHVRIGIEPFTLDDDGAVVSGRAAAGAHDATRWVRLNPSEAEIAPGESQVLRLTVSAPETARGTYWAYLFAETFSPAVAAPGDRPQPEPVRVGVRLGSFVYVEAGEIGKPAADLELTAWRQGSELAARAELVHRSGGVLRLTARFALSAPGAGASPEQPTELALLPGGRRVLRWAVPAPAAASSVVIEISGPGISLRRDAAAEKPPP
jgi:hypothetical protein